MWYLIVSIPDLCNLTYFVLSWVGLKINPIFSKVEGGTGVLPRKILKTKKAAEAISGHFVRTILPSVNEQFQRIMLPFFVCSFEI